MLIPVQSYHKNLDDEDAALNFWAISHYTLTVQKKRKKKNFPDFWSLGKSFVPLQRDYFLSSLMSNFIHFELVEKGHKQRQRSPKSKENIKHLVGKWKKKKKKYCWDCGENSTANIDFDIRVFHLVPVVANTAYYVQQCNVAWNCAVAVGEKNTSQ